MSPVATEYSVSSKTRQGSHTFMGHEEELKIIDQVTKNNEKESADRMNGGFYCDLTQ